MKLTGAKVVARYVDGRLVKGYTFDFHPRSPRFHIFPGRDASGPAVTVTKADLKALFVVRDLAGNPTFQERKTFAHTASSAERRVAITFSDGELLVGIAENSPAGLREDVVLTPADPGSNNLRVYAMATAIRHLQELTRPLRMPREVRQPLIAHPSRWGRLRGWLLTPQAARSH